VRADDHEVGAQLLGGGADLLGGRAAGAEQAIDADALPLVLGDELVEPLLVVGGHARDLVGGGDVVAVRDAQRRQRVDVQHGDAPAELLGEIEGALERVLGQLVEVEGDQQMRGRRHGSSLPRRRRAGGPLS
jgi:hypothetical protein